MKEITVKNKVAFIDDEDEAKVCQLNWCLNNRGYATASLRQGYRTGEITSMHELVFNRNVEGYYINHKDGNKLNNQKANLELVSLSVNQALKRKQKNNTSGYIGVSWAKNKGWLAYVKHNRKSYYLGYHSSAEVAAKIRDAKAKELFGSNITLNFP